MSQSSADDDIGIAEPTPILCCISGQIPAEPVLLSTGYVCEKRLADKYIKSHGLKCPVTNEPLAETEPPYVIIKCSLHERRALENKVESDLTFLDHLKGLRNFHEAVLLENGELLADQEKLRQQISTTLYEHDAACRVIASLLKEKNELTQKLASTGSDKGNSRGDDEHE